MATLASEAAVPRETSLGQVDAVTAILALAMLGGVAVRAIPVVPASFPLNDGGLFATMIEGLAHHGLAIPAFTRYNGGTIPFAYPPLALEFGAILHLLGLATTTILQWVPFVFSCLTIPAAYLALREMIGDRMHAAVATLFFALLPRSYLWLISGGGITRSLGLLLAILALWRLAAFTSTQHRSAAVQGGLLAGLAAMSHLEAAVLVTTGAIVLLARQRDWGRVWWLVLAGIVATAIAAPWFVSVIYRHGIEPFEAATLSRGISYPAALLSILSLNFTEEAYFALGSILGIVGLAHALLNRTLWPLGWVLMIFALMPGGGPTYAMLPWSVLISIAVIDAIGPHIRPTRKPVALAAAATVVLLASVWASQLPQNTLHTLSPEVRAAMDIVRRDSSQKTYVVISGVNWAQDATSEWFPYLTSKVSIATAQGSEFSSVDAWKTVIALDSEAQQCADRDASCLVQLSSDAPFKGVFLPKETVGRTVSGDCCMALRTSLRSSPLFAVTYDGPGATIAVLKRAQ